jgi:hypothetical protein
VFYGLLAVAGVLAITNVLTIRWAFAQIGETQVIAAHERDALAAAHIAQLSEFANRIQQPYRASHVSISEQAPESDPFVNPEIEEELELIGEPR